jgi:hypothetical protein
VLRLLLLQVVVVVGVLHPWRHARVCPAASLCAAQSYSPEGHSFDANGAVFTNLLMCIQLYLQCKCKGFWRLVAVTERCGTS